MTGLKFAFSKQVLPNIVAFSVLAFMVLFYLKKTTVRDLDWYLIALPLGIFTFSIGVIIYSLYSSTLRPAHEDLFVRLRLHLIVTFGCIFLFFYELSYYLN
jgi:uncharacterized membrane protein YbhN (UPF0104 family)